MILDDDEKYENDLENDNIENNDEGEINQNSDELEQLQGQPENTRPEDYEVIGNYVKEKSKEKAKELGNKAKNAAQNKVKKAIKKKIEKAENKNNFKSQKNTIQNGKSKAKSTNVSNKKMPNGSNKLAKTSGQAATKTAGQAGQVATNTVGQAGQAVTNTVGQAGQAATKTVGQAGQTVAKTAGEVGQTAVKTGQQVAQTTAKATAEVAKTTAKAGAEAAKATARMAAQVAKLTAKATATVAKAAATVGKAIAELLAAIGPIGWIIIGVVIVIILIAMLIWSLFNSVSENMSDVTESLSDGYTATSYVTEEAMGKGINITDELIEAYVSELEAMGISLDDLYLCGEIDNEQEANNPANIRERNKYLRKFLLASLVTQYPDYGITEDETHYNGIIKVRRASNTNTLEEARDLEYVTLDILGAMIDAVNSEMVSDTLLAYYPTTRNEVNIDSERDGIQIPAIIFLPEGAKDVPMVLMCHGFTGKKEGDNDHFLQLGELLAQNGIAAITIDFSACGDSGDSSQNYTLDNMEDDMDSAIEFMLDRYSIDETKIGIVGHSMGGRIASEYLDNVQAAALWAPANGDSLSGLEFLSDYNGLYETAEKDGYVDSGWDCNGKDFVLSRDFFRDMESSHPLKELNSFTGPILVAFGNSDDVIVEAKDDVQAAMPAQGMFKTYDQDHNFTMENDDERQLLLDTANLFTQAFYGRDANDGDEEVENPLAGQSVEDIRNKLPNVYSVDNNGNLYFASINSVQTTTLDNNNNEITNTTYTANQLVINYKKTVEKYALPMQASIALCLITQNPEYVADFIDEHVLSGEIEITILDTQRIDTRESWFDWTLDTTVTARLMDGSDTDVTTSTSNINRYNYNKTVNTSVSSIAAMTDVDTWMAKSSVDYTNVQNQIEYPLGQETVTKQAECPVQYKASDTVHLPLEIDGKIVQCEYTTTKKVSNCTFTETQKIEFNEWEKGTVFVDTDAISKKADSIIEQWKTVYKIPNMTTYESPEEKLYSGKQMLLELLNKEDTQKQVEIFEFLFKRAEDSNYSINNLDTSIYDDMELIVAGENDVIVDTTRSSSELVLDQEELQSAVSACYSGDIEANLLSIISAAYEVQRTYHVNAVFTISVAIQESSAGTNWDLIIPSTNNWYSIQGTGSSDDYIDRNGTRWKSYLDSSDAVRDFGDLIANRGPYFRDGNYSVATIGQKYCVPPEGWISGITSIMKRLYSAVGIDLEAVQNGTDESDRPSHGSPSPGTGNINSGSFLEIAKQCHDYIRANSFTYANSNEIPYPNGTTYTDCSAYVSWVIYEYGYTEFAGHQKTSGWFMGDGPASMGWGVYPASEAQPGDILAKSGHVEIYAGNGTYGAGGDEQINAEMSYVGCSLDYIINDGGFTRAIRVTQP